LHDEWFFEYTKFSVFITLFIFEESRKIPGVDELPGVQIHSISLPAYPLMKKILALVFLFTIALSCKDDDEAPQPMGKAIATVDDVDVDFKTFDATDVGGQMDLTFKNDELEIMIHLASIDSGNYTLSRSAPNLKTFTGMAFITGPDGKFLISTGGTVTVKVKNNLATGKFTIKARNFPGKEDSEITGAFDALPLGNLTSVSCVLDRYTEDGVTSDFRYNKDGQLTSVLKTSGATKGQKNFAWFQDKPIASFDGNQYVIFKYTSGRVGEMFEYTLSGSNATTASQTDHNKFGYSSSGQLNSWIYVFGTEESGDCFGYEGDNVTKEFFCGYEELAANYYTNYDTKNNPWQLLSGPLGKEIAIVYYLRDFFSPAVSKNNVGKISTSTFTYSNFNTKDYPQNSMFTGNGQTSMRSFRYKNCD
jgi:hypothetical protein